MKLTTTRSDSVAFLLGFIAAAVPGSWYLLTLSYGENGAKVALVVAAEFAAGFIAQYVHRSIRARRAQRGAKPR